MKLLAIETSTEACSIALHVDGVVRERFEIAPRRHAELALPWAEMLLAEAGISRAQLDAIAVGRGPGAFTGVRLAIAIAQGIALALDRPVVPVSTLAVLAMRALPSAPDPSDAGPPAAADVMPILATIDARMGEVYVGTFLWRDGLMQPIGIEAVGAPTSLAIDGLEAHPHWHAVGTGLSAVDGALPSRLHDRIASVDPTALPHAADLATLAVAAFARGEAVAPDAIEPAYLRNNVALTIVEQQALRASR